MKIVFMGTPEAAVPTLQKILKDGHEVVAVWTQPDRPAGRGRKLRASPVKKFALAHGLKVFQPEKIKTKKSIGLFKSHQADLAVVVAYGRILSKSYLGAYPRGCINVHFSLLPKYRGAAPVNWSIANGETETGVTTMQMDPGLDTGDILLQTKTRIGEQENAIELMERLAKLGADLLGKTLANLDTIEPLEQNDEEASLAPMLAKEEGMIDWGLAAREIADRVRGFQPFPRSFTSYNGQKLTIWSAIPEREETDKGVIGEILHATGEVLRVKCGGNSGLRISELQIEGRRRMMTKDFLNGVKLEEGAVLGG